jgi:hypothetical protein
MISVGIDPGKHGAVAWMDGERKVIEVRDCPLAGSSLDYAAMDDLLANAQLAGQGDDVRAVVEDTISVPHVVATGARFLPASDKTLHLSLGAWLALLGARGISTEVVHPKTWKRAMLAGVANDKAMEANVCKQLFQGHAVASQLHGPRGGMRDGRVDALLIAEYGRRGWKVQSRSLTPIVNRRLAPLVDGRYRGETPEE